MKQILSIAILWLFSAYGSQAQQTISGKIDVEGVERAFILYIPSGYTDGASLPLVFNFHGFGSNAVQEQFYTNMDAVAEANDFLVCYPNGIDAAWNVGWAFGSQANDVGFTEAMIDQFHSEYNVDLSKVYSCGMSNGGFFSYILACELNDKIAAVASVTGSIVPQYACTPDKAVPVMQIHGTADETVMYGGTPGVSIPVEDVVDFWAQNNGCATDASVTNVDDIDTTDSSTAERIEYDSCDNDASVVFYKVQGGAHTWPGATIPIGVTNQDFNASEEIWNFFMRYSVDGVISDVNNIRQVQSLVLVPNPTTNAIKLLDVDNSISNNYTIISMDGRVMKSGIYRGQDVSVEDLPTGLYYFKMGTGELVTINKFQKL